MTVSTRPARKLGLPIVSIDGAFRLVDRVNVTLRGSLIVLALEHGGHTEPIASFWREDVARREAEDLANDLGLPVSWPVEWKKRKRRKAPAQPKQPWEMAA